MDSEKVSPGRKNTPQIRQQTRFTIAQPAKGELLRQSVVEEESSDDEEKTPVNTDKGFDFGQGEVNVEFRRYRKLDGQCSIEVVETDVKPRKKSIIRQPVDYEHRSMMDSLDIPDHHQPAARRGSVHFDENPRVFEVPEHNNFDGADADSDGENEESNEEQDSDDDGELSDNSKLSRAVGTLQRKSTDDVDTGMRASRRDAVSTHKAPYTVPSLDETSDSEDNENTHDNQRLEVDRLSINVQKLLNREKTYGMMGPEPVTPSSTPYGTPAPSMDLPDLDSLKWSKYI